jgi:CHAD domain-containing protein
MAPSRADDLAGDVFADVLAEHVRRIQQRVPPALADEPDAVHRLRTAVRRLRTTLAVYRSVFDRQAGDDLRERLAELGHVLGPARDLEVRRDDVESTGRASRTPLAARERLVVELTEAHAAAHRDLLEWCAGERMRALNAELVRWVAAPPWAEAAEKPARKVARKRLRKAVRRALGAADDVDLGVLADRTEELARDTRPTADDLLDAAHRLRKAGRRLTHAARDVTRKPTKVLGSHARELDVAGKAVQSSLGDHRDALLLARRARFVADAVETEGGDRRPYDRLAHAAERRAHAALDDAARAVAGLRDVAGSSRS